MTAALSTVLFMLPMPGAALERVIAGPVRVIDGDTLDVGGHRIRLHGIDAPEMAQTCVTKAGVQWRCGVWVTRQFSDRFGGSMARCRAIETDRYGRTVATCRAAGVDMGAAMVREGLAFAYVRYSAAYVGAEREAARRGAGLHGHSVQKPSVFRKRLTSAQVVPSDCTIKGNISANGRIYHQPGQHDYDRTRISRRKGERWFCSGAEARKAGWRAAKR